MDTATVLSHRRDTAYQQEYGLPRIVSYELGQIPLEKTQLLLDDPVEFRIVCREFWLSSGGTKGGLTREELGDVCIQIFEQLGEWEEWTRHPTPEQIEEVFQKTDVNRSGLIEFEEFEAAARRVLNKIRCSKGARMLSNQGRLQKLPIPKLEDTVRRYKAALAALPLSAETRVRVDTLMEDLSGPRGQLVHSALQQYAKGKYSYVEEFWTMMYGRIRDSLPVNISPSVLFIQSKKVAHNRPLFKAARFISQLCAISDLIQLKLLEPDVVRGTPLCMWEYQFLFARTRIPDEVCDYNVVTSPAPISEVENVLIKQIRRAPRHILVMKKHRMFLLDVFHADGTVMSTLEVLQELEKIDMLCRECELAPALGALTANDRTQWAKDRKALTEVSEKNKQILEKIDSTILALCLDEIAPDPTSSTALAWVLHGDGRNRWFDKAVQIFVAKNGVAGMQFEHSSCDAWPYIRILVQLTQEMHSEHFTDFTRKGPAPLPKENRVEELAFDLTPDLHKSIENAEAAADRLCAKTAVRYLTFHRFGKDGIVKHNASPDAIIQAALITAFYLTRGYFPNTYSAGGTKQYLHGRTECVRSSTPEMFDFVQSYADLFQLKMGAQKSSDDADDVAGPTGTKQLSWEKLVRTNQKLRQALGVHVRKMIEAKFGQGCDRHLFAMRCIAGSGQIPQEAVPSIFTDSLFGESMSFNLSTSNVPANPYALSQVFGPVTPDGFGVCYSVYNTHITFGLTCWKQPDGDSPIDMFRSHLERTLTELEGNVLPAIPAIQKLRNYAQMRYAVLAMTLTRNFGWLTKLPLIGAIIKRVPLVGGLLDFKLSAGGAQ